MKHMPIFSSRGSWLLASALLSITFLGAGCGSTSQMIDTDTQTLNVEGTDGNAVSAGEGAKIPDNFPAFFPRYPNGKTTLAFTENNGTSGSLVQETSDPYTQAQAWVETAMQSQGFTKENALTSPDVVILTFTKGTTRCQINVVQQTGTTRIQTTCAEQQ